MASPFPSELPRIVVQEAADLPTTSSAIPRITSSTIPRITLSPNQGLTVDRTDLSISRSDVSATGPDVSINRQRVPINSPVWIDKMKKQFCALDIDRDGYITEDDVILLVSMLASMKEMTKKQEAEILRELRGLWLFGIELEGKASFHWAQYLDSMRAFVATPMARQRVRSYGEFLFRIIDTNGDGSASKEEIRGLVQGGGLNFSITEGLFENIKKDSSDRDVTLEEWLQGLEDFMFTDNTV